MLQYGAGDKVKRHDDEACRVGFKSTLMTKQQWIGSYMGHSMQHYRILARLGVEPRPSGYIPGVLPIELPSLGYKVVLLLPPLWQIGHPTVTIAD